MATVHGTNETTRQTGRNSGGSHLQKAEMKHNVMLVAADKSALTPANISARARIACPQGMYGCRTQAASAKTEQMVATMTRSALARQDCSSNHWTTGC